jgi:hypothetical protein
MVLFKTLHILLKEVAQNTKQVDCICEHVTLFMNKGAEGAMNFVKSTDKGGRYILLGAPGAGKSSIWWIEVCRLSFQHQEDVFVCIWTLKRAFHGILILKGGVITEGAYSPGHVKVDIVELMGQLRDMSQYADAHFIVDGVNNEDFQSVNSVPGGWLLVSSIGLRFSTGAISVQLPRRFYMDSWSKEEYIEAINIEYIKNKIPLEADCKTLGLKENDLLSWVEGKYFYAGGSARMMLEFPLKDVLDEIKGAMSAVHNVNLLLEDAESSIGRFSISTVRQCFQEKYIMLSQYVTRLLLMRQDVTRTFLTSAIHHAGKNPALMGWIFELKMLWTMRQHISTLGHEQASCYQMNLEELPMNSKKEGGSKQKRGSQGEEKPIELLLQGEEHFAEIADLTETSLASKDILISPDRFNFGCFDAAVVLFSGEANTLITLQATTSESHSFKPYFVAELIQHLAQGKTIPSNLKVWHVFVLENIEQFNRFHCPDKQRVTISRSTRATRSHEVDTVFWKTVLKEQKPAPESVLKQKVSAAQPAQKKSRGRK